VIAIGLTDARETNSYAIGHESVAEAVQAASYYRAKQSFCLDCVHCAAGAASDTMGSTCVFRNRLFKALGAHGG
jgi:hypothetical protein